MPPAKPTHADLLVLLQSKAQGLREVGVRTVELDGLKFELAPALVVDLTQRVERDEADLAEEMDPLLDRATYGGGRVPGFQRPDSDEDN